MNHIFYRLLFVFLISLIFVGCKHDDPIKLAEKGEINFHLQSNNKDPNGRMLNLNIEGAHAILITITSHDGSPTQYSTSEIELYELNGELISQKISLTIGNYILTEFMVIDANNEIINATPVEGSSQAQNVNDPLPIDFIINIDQITALSLEVISTQDLQLDDFGLIGFELSQVDLLKFFINVSEQGNLENLLTAELDVISDSYSFSQNLEAIANNLIVIKDGFPYYNINISSEGYESFTTELSRDSLIQHRDIPLTIELTPKVINLEANFESSTSSIEQGTEITFTDSSLGAPASWEWTFEGGTPATSTNPNPTVTYSTAGIHDVTLTVTNDFETNTLTSKEYVIVFPTAGLIAYYPFNGNANDEGGNNLNGEVIGANLTSDKNGNANQAYHFDGVDDRVEVANNTLLEPQTYTLSAWIKTENESGVVISQTDFDPITNNCGYILSVKYGNIRGFSNINSGTWAKNIDDNIVSLNEWHHLLFTYNGQTLNLYYDGVKVSSEDIPHTVNYTEHNPMQIGSYSSNSGPSAFTGDIDAIRIFDRALDEIEIKALARE